MILFNSVSVLYEDLQVPGQEISIWVILHDVHSAGMPFD